MDCIDQEDKFRISLSFLPLKGRIPHARANFSTEVFQRSKLLIQGGDNQESEFSDMWELNLRTKAWRLRKELKEPLVGHKSIKLRVLSKDTLMKGAGRAMLTYGGWMRNLYSDTLFLMDMSTFEMKECPRKPRSRIDEAKMTRTTLDTMKHIEIENSIPDGRRDHTMCFHAALSAVVVIGGWNSLEWHPDKVELEVWLYTSGTPLLTRVALEARRLGCGQPGAAEPARTLCGV